MIFKVVRQTSSHPCTESPSVAPLSLWIIQKLAALSGHLHCLPAPCSSHSAQPCLCHAAKFGQLLTYSSCYLAASLSSWRWLPGAAQEQLLLGHVFFALCSTPSHQFIIRFGVGGGSAGSETARTASARIMFLPGPPEQG